MIVLILNSGSSSVNGSHVLQQEIPDHGVALQLVFKALLHPHKNKIRGQEADISTDPSLCRVLLIPTNEELMIALQTVKALTTNLRSN